MSDWNRVMNDWNRLARDAKRIVDLEAEVDELTAALNKYSEDEMLLSDKATITKLEAKVDTVNQTLTLSLKNESDLEAKLIEAEERADEYYELNEKLIAKVEGWKAQDAEGNRLLAKERAKVEELTAENADSKREAESLAMALWRRHYQETSPDFELCDTTAGVITQIDNMTAGVIQNNENQCAVIISLQAKIEELTALAEPMTKALYKEMANRHTAITIENTELQAKVEKLDNFIELVEGALGCTDGDDIRTHIKPELAALKQENE